MAGVDTKVRGADKKEAFHREAESRIAPFGFRRPAENLDSSKAVFYLAHSDLMIATVQIITEGGDNNMHYHPGRDSFWMVLKGRLRFHGSDGVIGEYGPNEGLLMPRNARYWFETADPNQELHLLHVEANTGKDEVKRVNLMAKKPDHQPNRRFNYPEGVRDD